MKETLQHQRDYFKGQSTKPYAFRRAMLLRLKRMITENESDIKAALKKDLNKSSFESYATEIGYTLHSITKTLKYLKKWMKVEKVKTPFYHFFTKSYIQRDPLGNVLIIGPYNYPFQLTIEPLIGAIAGGNTAIIKPSEFPTHTEKLIETLINKTFESHYIHVFTGGKETTQTLLSLKFDLIFFTGSPRVGQIVYEAASKHLTPVVLELGGKSPAVVDRSADLRVAARRIAWGKYLNAGQTCIAPDFVYIDKRIKDEFLDMLTLTLDEFYGGEKDDFPVIINDDHYARITGLIDEDKVVYGNHRHKERRYLSPTVMDGVTFEDAIMKEEIFGPVLPVITFSDLDDVIYNLKKQPSPLAFYVFSNDTATRKRLFRCLSFGNGAINDTINQVANFYLPFGGTGRSGFGKYHGRHSFETFTHAKSFMKKSTVFDKNPAYPPYGNKEKLIRKIFK